MFKNAVCIYHGFFSLETLFEGCGMYISSSVHLKESCLKFRYEYIMQCSSQEKLFKVAVCIYHKVFISWKVV